MGHLQSSKSKLTNRKILKLFALREFSHLANLFALTEIAIARCAGSCTEADAKRILSSPSVLKIADFGDAVGSFANLLNRSAPERTF